MRTALTLIFNRCIAVILLVCLLPNHASSHESKIYFQKTISSVKISIEPCPWDGSTNPLLPADSVLFSITAKNTADTASVLHCEILTEKKNTEGQLEKKVEVIHKLLYPQSEHCIGPGHLGKFVKVLDMKVSALEADSLKESEGTKQKSKLFSLLGMELSLDGVFSEGKIGPCIIAKTYDEPVYLLSENNATEKRATEWDGSEIRIHGKLRFHEGPQGVTDVVTIAGPYFFFDMSEAKLERLSGINDPLVSVVGELRKLEQSDVIYLDSAYKGGPVFLVNFNGLNGLSGRSPIENWTPGTRIKAIGRLHFWNHDYSKFQPLIKIPAFKPHYFFDVSETTFEPLGSGK